MESDQNAISEKAIEKKGNRSRHFVSYRLHIRRATIPFSTYYDNNFCSSVVIVIIIRYDLIMNTITVSRLRAGRGEKVKCEAEFT